MALKTEKKSAAFALPAKLTGQTELNRLLRELESIDELGKSHQDEPPATSLLKDVADANSYELADDYHRKHLQQQLKAIHDSAPVLHISFASEPNPAVTEKILQWLRSNIHRYALLQIGLQPGIAAGCILRTDNRVFDMSLGAGLEKQKDYLLQLISAAVEERPMPGRG